RACNPPLVVNFPPRQSSRPHRAHVLHRHPHPQSPQHGPHRHPQRDHGDPQRPHHAEGHGEPQEPRAVPVDLDQAGEHVGVGGCGAEQRGVLEGGGQGGAAEEGAELEEGVEVQPPHGLDLRVCRRHVDQIDEVDREGVAEVDQVDGGDAGARRRVDRRHGDLEGGGEDVGERGAEKEDAPAPGGGEEDVHVEVDAARADVGTCGGGSCEVGRRGVVGFQRHGVAQRPVTSEHLAQGDPHGAQADAPGEVQQRKVGGEPDQADRDGKHDEAQHGQSREGCRPRLGPGALRDPRGGEGRPVEAEGRERDGGELEGGLEDPQGARTAGEVPGAARIRAGAEGIFGVVLQQAAGPRAEGARTVLDPPREARGAVRGILAVLCALVPGFTADRAQGGQRGAVCREQPDEQRRAKEADGECGGADRELPRAEAAVVEHPRRDEERHERNPEDEVAEERPRRGGLQSRLHEHGAGQRGRLLGERRDECAQGEGRRDAESRRGIRRRRRAGHRGGRLRRRREQEQPFRGAQRDRGGVVN
ncbi:hypothetical protein DFJ74DRAFT_745992, partial [Hyaloraphidium curvatum]